MPTVGMAVTTGIKTAHQRAALANALEAAIPHADACGLWFNGRPATETLSALVEQIRETLKPRAEVTR